MFYEMPGGCQAPTRYEENCSCGAQKFANSDKALSEKHQQNCLESTQLLSEEGNQCPALDVKHYSLSLPGRDLKSLKNASKTRALCINSHHSRCLELHDKGRKEFPAIFGYRKSPQESSSQMKRTDNRVAWMTLDGLLVHGVDVPSTEMGKFLGHQELVAWNGFAPLQKVLIVAVTAAAAVAAKQRHTKDMRRLQLAIATRDKECEILREKIIELQEHLSFWKEQAQNFCEDMEANGKEITDSFLLNLGLENTPKSHSTMLEQFATPQIQQSSVKMLNYIACFGRNLGLINFKNDRDIRAHSPITSTRDNNEQNSWDRLSESPTVIEGQSTPQIPFTQLNKICTPSSNISPKQVGRLSRYCQKGCRRVNGTEDTVTPCIPSTEFFTIQKEQLFGGQVMINDNCKTRDRMIERLESDRSLTISDWRCCKSNKGDETNVESPFRAVVRKTVDGFWGPIASMEAESILLQDSEMAYERKEAERKLAESGFHTCKELETTLDLLYDTEKRLESCREACSRKDKTILKLEDEVIALQELVTQLRSLQATPRVVGQQDPSPVQTFLTSNLLFNLDSPLKFSSPLSAKSSFSSWRGLDELSKVSDSLDRESRAGSCEREMNKLEQVHTWQTADGNKKEQECISSVREADINTTTNKHTVIGESRKIRKFPSSEDVRRSDSSTDEPFRKSTSSSTDESGSNAVRHGHIPQLPKKTSSQARKLKFSNAGDARLPTDHGRRMPSTVEASVGVRHRNILASVEPNTPLRERKVNGSNSKDKLWSHHSLDSISKAKENLAHRRRWI